MAGNCYCDEYDGAVDGAAHYECYEHSPKCICGAEDFYACWLEEILNGGLDE